MSRQGDCFVSIVIPALNEAGNLAALCERIDDTISDCLVRFEIIIVDDGSTDNTFAVACDLRDRYHNLSVIRLSRNFGKDPAIMAGLRGSRGDAVITIDADLQHPPELIPKLIEKWRQGRDVVHTIREESEASGGTLKRVASRIFYAFLRSQSNLDIRPGMADFRLIDRRVLDEMLRLREANFFLRGLAVWVGYSQDEIRYRPGRRHDGSSSYSISQLVALARTGVVSFSSAPLYWTFGIGIATSLVGICYGCYAVGVRFLSNVVVPGWASLAVLLTFLFGVHFILLGVFGMYLGALYDECKRRPLFLVREHVDSHDESDAPTGRRSRTALNQYPTYSPATVRPASLDVVPPVERKAA